MSVTRKESNGNHGYAAPVAMIFALLFGYWLISEWKTLPDLLGSAIAIIR